MHSREINTCLRCRDSKRKCDKAKPSCSRCVRAGVKCVWDPSSGDISTSTDGEETTASSFFCAAPPSTEASSLGSYSPLPASGSIGFGNDDITSPSLVDMSPQQRPLAQKARSGHAVRKRNRARLSCTRCHRLKVKCDRREPYCNRCALSGFAKTCIYTHRAHQITEAPGSFTEEIPAGEFPEEYVTGWFMRQRVSRHWGALLHKVSEC